VQIPGRLSETTLGDVLGALLRERVTGLVRLRETLAQGATREHRVYLKHGEVVAVETDAKVPALGEILVQHGLLDATAQRRLRQRMTAGARRPVGELLVEEGYVSREVVGAALHKQLRSNLDALGQILEATLSFHVACVAPPCPVAPLTPREFLRGRPRARDRAARTSRTYEYRKPPSPPASESRSSESRRNAAWPDPSTRKRREALALLGLEDGATKQEVTRAFRQWATRLHPDLHMQASETERRAVAERFAALSAAYHAVVG
jgi:hypothetical protein